MAVGDGLRDADLLAGWDAFCEDLKRAGRRLFVDEAPATPVERAESFRLMTHVISLAFDWFVEDEGPLHPRLIRKYSSTRRTTGHNNSGLFHVAFIDGQHTYRIVGNIGTARQWGISVLRPGAGPQAYHLYPYEESFVPEVQVFRDELDIEWDGSFVLTLSPTEHDGNWIRTTPETCGIRIREYFLDWSREDPMAAKIECVDADEPPPLLTPDRLLPALRQAGDYITRLLEGYGEHRITPEARSPTPANVFRKSEVLSGDPLKRGTDTMPLGNGATCRWELQEDEALVVCLERPQTWWSSDVFSHWYQPGDYRHRPVTLNSEQAVLDDQGSAWIVVAHEDPGTPNWLDVGSYTRGTMSVRFYVTDRQPVIHARLAKLSDVRSIVPPSVPDLAPHLRRAQARQRERGIFRRYRS